MMKAIETSEGKLCGATLSALGNRGLEANMMAKQQVLDYLYWPWMVKMNEVEHPFDMAQPMQSAAASFEKLIATLDRICMGFSAREFGGIRQNYVPRPPYIPFFCH